MIKTLRRITRSGFAERLGLFGADLSPRQGSVIGDATTTFYSLNGERVGMFTRHKCPITGKFDDQFFIAVPLEEPAEAHSSLWL